MLATLVYIPLLEILVDPCDNSGSADVLEDKGGPR